MVLCFDIDGVICSRTDGAYEKAQPFHSAIQRINRLYDEGHTIKYFTARGGTTGRDWTDFTRKQLEDWGVKYHQLIMGKPPADYYVDDKSIDLVDLLEVLL